MNKPGTGKLIFLSLVVLLILAGTAVFMFRSHNQERLEPPTGKIAANETDPAVWGKYYPAHYDSYLQNFENKEKPSHFVTAPYMQTLYAGTGFAAEFNEPRGHVYTLEDIRNINPKRKKAGAVCNTCKSSEIPAIMQKYGDKYYLMDFDSVNRQLNHPIACLDCHDPDTMELRITRPALREALQRRGQNPDKMSRQDMRSLVCAQCHVTYYFEPGTKRLTFPWDQGFTADDILAYYDAKNFVEWTHPDAGTGLVKARHAEYETFQGSTHQSAGLACADCHMPYVKVGNVKISSHHWTNPKENLEESCTVCHREDTKWLENRIETIKQQTRQAQDLAGNTLVEAVNELKTARNTPGVDQDLLKKAQDMHRKGQWYLDYVMVTNGWGFHNPGSTMSDLTKAIDYGHQAINLAHQACLKAKPAQGK